MKIKPSILSIARKLVHSQSANHCRTINCIIFVVTEVMMKAPLDFLYHMRRPLCTICHLILPIPCRPQLPYPSVPYRLPSYPITTAPITLLYDRIDDPDQVRGTAVCLLPANVFLQKLEQDMRRQFLMTWTMQTATPTGQQCVL